MSAGAWVMSGRLFNPQGEDLRHFANDLMAQYTGFDTREGFPKWSIPWGLVSIVTSQIGAKVAQKFGGSAISKLPFVGKYVKW
jgi:hypothetical protein